MDLKKGIAIATLTAAMALGLGACADNGTGTCGTCGKAAPACKGMPSCKGQGGNGCKSNGCS